MQANVHVICVTCGEDLWRQCISYVKHTAVKTPMPGSHMCK